MKEPQWVRLKTVLALHDSSLAEFGGLAGVRDVGMLESALSRPQNLYAYGNRNIVDLAAAYAYAIAQNHPFIDGNKRVAFLASTVFLETNGYKFVATEADAAATMLLLAANKLSQSDFTEWLATNSRATR